MESRVLESGIWSLQKGMIILMLHRGDWRSFRGRIFEDLRWVLLFRAFFFRIAIFSSRAASSIARKCLSFSLPVLDALISLEPAGIISMVVSAYKCSKFNAAISPSEKETSTKDLPRLVYVRPSFLMAIQGSFRDIRLTIIRETSLMRLYTCVYGCEVLSSTFKATSLNLDRVGKSNRKSELSASARTAFCRKPFAKLRPRSRRELKHAHPNTILSRDIRTRMIRSEYQERILGKVDVFNVARNAETIVFEIFIKICVQTHTLMYLLII